MTEGQLPARRAALLMLEEETRGLEEPAPVVAALQAALTRMSELMTTVVGPMGYRALLVRALRVVGRRDDWWSEVTVEEEPSPRLAGLTGAMERAGVETVRAGVADLLAEVIGLHCDFIGDDLTFRLLRRVWRGLSDDDGRPATEDS